MPTLPTWRLWTRVGARERAAKTPGRMWGSLKGNYTESRLAAKLESKEGAKAVSTGQKVQQTAAYESPRTTKLYDRVNKAVSLDGMGRVGFLLELSLREIYVV